MVRASLTISDADTAIWPILIDWGKGRGLRLDQLDQLITWTLRRQEPAVWQWPAASLASIKVAIETRAALMQTFCAQLDAGEMSLPVPGMWTDWIALLWTLWLPLAQQIDQKQRASNLQTRSQSHQRVFIQGLLGGQGTGKTTLTKILTLILGCLDQQAVSLSIDDLYLSYAKRCALKREDPRLIWRGPPGTHDVRLGVQRLTEIRHCKAGQSVLLPQFDKALHGGEGDRTSPLSVRSPTVVLFEGWFMGTQPLPHDVIASPSFSFPFPIVTAEDRQFAQDCNRRLIDYLPLWALIDDLVVLQPQDYRFSLQWRQAAERKMIAQSQANEDASGLANELVSGLASESAGKKSSEYARAKSGMSDAQVAEFVRYFWKALHPELFITPLTTHKNTSLVVNLDATHQLSNLRLP
ncbi:MAG: glycerate kinase [Cyanobacteria bacterium J06621_11]